MYSAYTLLLTHDHSIHFCVTIQKNGGCLMFVWGSSWWVELIFSVHFISQNIKSRTSVDRCIILQKKYRFGNDWKRTSRMLTEHIWTFFCLNLWDKWHRGDWGDANLNYSAPNYRSSPRGGIERKANFHYHLRYPLG